MKHFKVTVQYLNGVDFIYECDAQSNWQAAAMARVEGRRMGFGGAMDVKNTCLLYTYDAADEEDSVDLVGGQNVTNTTNIKNRRQRT